MSAGDRYRWFYEEGATLKDGTPVRLRLVRRGDKGLLLEAWGRLSPESRYRRFLSPKAALTPGEVRYLPARTSRNRTGNASAARPRIESLTISPLNH